MKHNNYLINKKRKNKVVKRVKEKRSNLKLSRSKQKISKVNLSERKNFILKTQGMTKHARTFSARRGMVLKRGSHSLKGVFFALIHRTFHTMERLMVQKKYSYKFLAGILIVTFVTPLLSALPVGVKKAEAVNTKIRQEINIVDTYVSSVSGSFATSSGIVQLDDTKYTSPTYFFEVVASTSASIATQVFLRNATSSRTIATIDIPAGTTSYTRLRSSAFNPNASTTELVAVVASTTGATKGIKAARIIVLQDTTSLYNTETQIEIGNNETYTSTATSTFASPKYWYYDSTKWDSTLTFYAEVTYANTFGGATTTNTFSDAGSSNIVASTTVAEIAMWGGGGAGFTGSNSGGGRGGGGGAFASSTITLVPGTTYPIIVGAGGTVSAQNGATTTFNTNVVVAAPGWGGTTVTTGGGLGGATASSTGTVTRAGGRGGIGNGTDDGGGGGGGAGGPHAAGGVGVDSTTTVGGNGGQADGTLGGGGGNGGNVGVGQPGTSNTTNGGGGGGGGDNTFAGGAGATYGGGGGGGEGGKGNGAAGAIKFTFRPTASTTITLQEDNGSFGSWTDKVEIVRADSFAVATATRVRSAAFTPTTGRNYRIAFKENFNGATHGIYNAKIVVDQGDKFVQEGNSLAVSTVGIRPALAALNSTDVAFIDGGNDSLRTYRFDGTNWSQVGNSLAVTTGNFVSLAALNSTDVAYIDVDNDSLRTYRFDGTDWSQVGNSLAVGTVGNVAHLDALTSTDIVFLDDSNDSLRTYRFDGTNWSQVGNSLVVATAFAALAALNSTDVASIDSTRDSLLTYRFDGTDWSQVGNSLAVVGTRPALTALTSTDVAFIDDGNDSLRTYRFDGTDWSQVGGNLAVSTVANPALAALNSTDVAYIDETNDSLRTYTKSTLISKTEPQYLLANTLVNATGLGDFDTLYDSAEWEGTTNVYVHQIESSTDTSDSAKLQSNVGGVAVDVTNSTATGANRATSTTAGMTMPSGTEAQRTMDVNVLNVPIYASRILVQVSITSSPALSQTHYRWRYDNGSEVAADFRAAEDTALTSGIYLGDRIRLRFMISNTGGAATDYTYLLEHASSSCTSGWIPVPTLSTQNPHWIMDISGRVEDGTATTDVASGLTNPTGTFVTGQFKSTGNQTSAITLASDEFTENEFSIRSTNQVSTGTTYCFRTTNAGATTGFTFTQTPQIAVLPVSSFQGGGGGGGEGSGSGAVITGGNSGGGGSGGAGGEAESGGGGEQGGGGAGGGGGGDSGFLFPFRFFSFNPKLFLISDTVFSFFNFSNLKW